MSNDIRWEALLWEAREFLRLDQGEPVPLEELRGTV